MCGMLLCFVLVLKFLHQGHKLFKLQNSLGGNRRPEVETPVWSNSLFTPYFIKTPSSYKAKHNIDKQVFAQSDFTCCDPCCCYWKALLVLNLKSTFNISERRVSFPVFPDGGDDGGQMLDTEADTR